MSLRRIREAARQRLAEAERHWQRLAPGQRRALGLAALLLPALLLWLGLVEPAWQRRGHWQAELPRLRAEAQSLERLLGGAVGPASSLLREGLDNTGLAGHYQLQGAAGSWRLELRQAPAAATLEWLLGVAPGLPLRVRQVWLRRDGDDSDGRLSGIVEMEWQAKEPT